MGAHRPLGRARGIRIVATACIVLLLAIVLAAVLAPWSPATSEASAALLEDSVYLPGACCVSGRAVPADPETVTFPSETGSGVHLAGLPVSIAFDRTAVATG